MFVCFCTCEYVQFVGSRQNKKCVLWYKLEGCIYIDWRICVFNVHLPLELSFFLWSIPFYTQTFWTERFEISFDICRPCVWYEWLRVCVLYARPFVDLIYSNFCLGDMVTDSTSVKWYCLRISRNTKITIQRITTKLNIIWCIFVLLKYNNVYQFDMYMIPNVWFKKFCLDVFN